MTTIEQNKAIVIRFFEKFGNEGNAAMAGELFSDDFVDHAAPPGTPAGPEGAKQFLAKARSAFFGLHTTIEDLIGEKDKVAVRVTVRGTHKGDWMGMSPTGKQVTWKGMDIFHIVDGKIMERWVLRDHLSLIQQLGG